MKHIAIYGRFFKDQYTVHIQDLFKRLVSEGCSIYLYRPFYNYLIHRIQLPKNVVQFESNDFSNYPIELLISIGGDGTILESATIVKDRNIPILGINTGRLGFLSTVTVSESETVLNDIFTKRFTIEYRDLIELESEQKLFGTTNFGLNEIVVHKKDTSSMITINVFIDGELLNAYWADGLIISTPTGSTAYSLSCGGPMLFPDAQNFVITPVAPHNLNARPFVVPNNKEIVLQVEGRSNQFLVSLDSRMETISSDTKLRIKKSSFQIPLLRLEKQTFISTIRQKLHWGFDHRN